MSLSKQIVDPPVRKIREPSVEVVKAMPKERLRQHTGEHSLDTPVAVQHRVSMVADRHIPPITNEKGRSSQTVIDRLVQEAERCQDENETNKAKTEAKNGMEKYRVTGRNTAIEGEPKFKFQAGNEKKNRESCA